MIREVRFLTAAAVLVLSIACGGDGPVAPAGVPARLDLRALPDTAGVGDTLVPDVRVLDGRGAPVTETAVVLSSDHPLVVAVLPNGAFRAMGEGWTYVRATAGDARDSARVVVRRVARGLRIVLPVDSIEFSAAFQLSPSVVVVDGLDASMGAAQDVRFSSSDTSVLRVDAATGLATVVNAGSAQLVAVANGFEARRTIRATLYEPFAGVGEVREHSTGRAVTCARVAAGATYCQAATGRALAGIGGGDQTVPLTPVPAPAPFVSVGTGFNATCGLTAAGDAYCWGTGLSPISSIAVERPVAMPKPAGVTAWSGLAFNHRSTDHCLLDQDGKAWCWGSNQFGAIGPSLGFHGDLWRLEGAPSFTKVATSLVHGCGMTATGELWCWGDTQSFTRGDPSGEIRPPTRVTLPRALRDFSTTFQGTCVLYVEGDVECWGYNQARSLGLPASEDYLLPARVPLPGKFVTLHSGGVGSCALSDVGELWCWGALRGWDPAGVAPFRFAPGYTFADAKLASTGLVALLCARTTTGRVLCTQREDAR